MAFTGGVVLVGVGGTAVGVSVGGIGVADGTVVAVGGTDVGMLVTMIGVPDVAHPARINMLAIIIANTDNFLNISASFMAPRS